MASIRKRSLLQMLLSYLVGEHICVAPDAKTRWAMVSEQVARQLGSDIYVCPECGQHMVRSAHLEQAA